VLFALATLHDVRSPPPEAVEQQEEGTGSD
jgi:hypothetical protein